MNCSRALEEAVKEIKLRHAWQTILEPQSLLLLICTYNFVCVCVFEKWMWREAVLHSLLTLPAHFVSPLNSSRSSSCAFSLWPAFPLFLSTLGNVNIGKHGERNGLEISLVRKGAW